MEASKHMRVLLDSRHVMVFMSPYPTKALTLRTSAQVYNTLDDFEHLAQAVLEYSRRLEQ